MHLIPAPACFCVPLPPADHVDMAHAVHEAHGPLRHRSHERQELFQRAHWKGKDLRAMFFIRARVNGNLHTGDDMRNAEIS